MQPNHLKHFRNSLRLLKEKAKCVSGVKARASLLGLLTFGLLASSAKGALNYTFEPDGTGGTTVTLGGTTTSTAGASFSFSGPITINGNVVNTSSGPEVYEAWGTLWPSGLFVPLFGLGPGQPSIVNNGLTATMGIRGNELSPGSPYPASPGGTFVSSGSKTFTSSEMAWSIFNPGTYTSAAPVSTGGVDFGVITFNVVPEPSSLGLLGLGGLALLRRRR